MSMKPVAPIFVNELFEPLLDRLLSMLRQLSEDEWRSDTPCAGWTVKDIVLHLLGDEIGKLSRGRDKEISYELPAGANFIERINNHNRLWLEATRRMSPRLACELLDKIGREVIQYFKSLDLMEMNGSVSWAGSDPAPVWFDVAREYTERWHHQQHIREALQRPGLTEATFLAPVLDTFVRALPYTYRSVEAPEQTVVELVVVGDAGRSWSLLRQEARWSLFTETPFAAAAIVKIDQEAAWRLFTRGIEKEQARAASHIQGDEELASHIFDAVSIIA